MTTNLMHTRAVTKPNCACKSNSITVIINFGFAQKMSYIELVGYKTVTQWVR